MTTDAGAAEPVPESPAGRTNGNAENRWPPTSAEEFEEFVRAYQWRLQRAAYLITGDRQLAEDLLQDALIKLARHWTRVHTDPASYVRTILYRDAASWWRRRRREVYLESLPDQRVADGADGAVVRIEFARALAKLAPKQRAVLVLRFFDDLPVHEVARVLGVSEGTVKRQTYDGLRRLRSLAPELLTEGGD